MGEPPAIRRFSAPDQRMRDTIMTWKTQRTILLAGLLAGSGPALADLINGPDPYAPGYGFDLPQEAAWGGWSRGDAGTLYAEWDSFSDASHGTASDRTAAPDVGNAGTSSAVFGWNTGTAVDGNGNLNNTSSSLALYIDIPESVAIQPDTNRVRAVLQFETWGNEVEYDNILLNGVEPTQLAWTFSDAGFELPVTQEPAFLIQVLAYWDFFTAPAGFSFDLTAIAETSFTQAAVDISSVPEPATLWLMATGIGAVARGSYRRQSNGLLKKARQIDGTGSAMRVASI
jgi:hypothetical protein